MALGDQSKKLDKPKGSNSIPLLSGEFSTEVFHVLLAPELEAGMHLCFLLGAIKIPINLERSRRNINEEPVKFISDGRKYNTFELKSD